MVTAVLQSPAFVYLTELGSGPARDGVVTLTPHETAASRSYSLTGGPPDEPLAQAAAAGKLATPAEREAQARRLLALPGARPQLRRLVKEWLDLDEIAAGLDGAVKDEVGLVGKLLARERLGRCFARHVWTRSRLHAEPDADLGDLAARGAARRRRHRAAGA